MIGRTLVDELSEDRGQDEKIIKSFYSKDSLSLDIFEKTGNTYKMIEPVRDKLLSISDKFIDFLGVDFFIHDIVLTGSLANYNWSEYSDLDLHIVIDYEESGHNIALLTEFFNAKRKVWNDTHNIKIRNYEVEIYVQDMKEKHVSSGVYSILNNIWAIEPQKEKEKIDDKIILTKGEEYAKLIDDLIEKKNKGTDVGNEIDNVRKKIKRFRQSGLDKGGEYSYENLTFKLLRRNGYIEKLMNLKKEVVNKNLSVNEEKIDLMPDELINTFYERIKKLINTHKDKNHPLIKKELDRIISLNTKIPQKIKDLLNESVNKKASISEKKKLSESVEFTDRDILRVEKAALKFYGETYSFTRAGYITPNGYLLDFSDGTSSRSQDHRNIGYVLKTVPNLNLGEYAGDTWKYSASWAMYAVLDMGFIRYLPESHLIHMLQMPSQEQFERIRELIEQQNGKIILQVNDSGYTEYESNTPEEFIIDGIKKYFREGIKPTSQMDDEDLY
jgi:hypothetical protein